MSHKAYFNLLPRLHFFISLAMPGTIRVSVLEFIDLPKLSPSPVSIKISMGRRHFEAWDKGDFSFPLTTLRDDVILIVQDAEGNEISRAGVQAKSIVEKGYWDDLFPLEGGGRVHMQFQFALSEDDRNRIRKMRETVLKRKHVELQDKNLKSSGINLASSFYLNPELSDSQKCLLQIGDLSSKEAAHQSPTASTENFPDNVKLVTEDTEVICLDQMQQPSVENDADKDGANSSAIHLLQDADANQPKVNNIKLAERIETQSLQDPKASKTIPVEENLFHSQGLEFSNAPEKNEDKTLDSAETPPRGKTPGNVKKVISAFESSLTQDTRPHIKPTLRNTQYSAVEKQTSLKEMQSKKATEENTKAALLERTLSPPFEREFKHDLAYVKKMEEKHNFIETLDGNKLSEDSRQSLKLKGTESQTGGENLSGKDKFGEEHKEIDAKNNGKSYQMLMRATKLETITVSERMVDDHSIPQQPSKSVPDKPYYDRNSVIEESKMQRPSRNSQEMNVQGTSATAVKSGSRIKDEQFPSNSYGGWIFPDEGRWLCVTTGGNQMLDQVGGRTSNTLICKEEMKISMEENRGSSEIKADGGTHNHKKIIQPKSSENVNTSGGPLANALKIAIMIGFGTLVLLTRQRKKKK